MNKSLFSIHIISKTDADKILSKFHYLKDKSKSFKSGVNYGLFLQDRLVGVCIFTGFPVPELAVGMLGLKREDQKGLWELSRLCVEPITQHCVHNITSWFVARCIKKLRKSENVRVILSYADSDYHKGTVYKALGFDYYGKTALKKDFWIKQKGDKYVKHSRGKTKGITGEWRTRSQKHRFVKTFDNTLNIKWSKHE